MLDVKAIVPWLLQLAPPGAGVLLRVTAAPPLMDTFSSFPLAKNPTHWPSGEKKGLMAPSVPAMGLVSKLSIART